jgi:hypothetical protein
VPEHAYRIVDVFTKQAFGGNPLAVFPGAESIDPALFQKIARELNLSETTFVLPPTRPDCDVRVRIFTPARELPMAGHPTVGTAFVLDRGSRIVFEEGVGPIVVERVGAARWRMTQPPPVFGEPRLDRAALAQALRLARWAGDRTWRDRLVLVLHVAYAFVPLGFALAAAAALGLLPASAGIHAWTVGAAGLMTMAVMTRASLGHTGRSLVASRTVQAIYALLAAAALARICAAVRPDHAIVLLHAAWLAWVGGFLAFAVHYWPVLTGPRLR